MKIAPCKKCEKRTDGCRSWCRVYKDWSDDNAMARIALRSMNQRFSEVRRCQELSARDVIEVRLLRYEEARLVPDVYLAGCNWWWLQDPVDRADRIAYVTGAGKIQTEGMVIKDQDGGIRPVLVISNDVEVRPGTYIDINGIRTRYIGHRLAIVEKLIAYGAFDRNSAEYSKSLIRRKIDAWAKEKIWRL